MKNEEWKRIEGFEDYKISDLGRVKSFKLGKERILKPSKDTGGYLLVSFYNKKPYTKKIHRLVALAFLPNIEKKRCINHRDFDITNNHIENLEWCTHKENIQHSVSHNRWSKVLGEDRYNVKLKERDIPEIMAMRKNKMKLREIGELFGVSYGTIWSAVNGKSWKHITEG